MPQVCIRNVVHAFQNASSFFVFSLTLQQEKDNLDRHFSMRLSVIREYAVRPDVVPPFNLLSLLCWLLNCCKKKDRQTEKYYFCEYT